MSFLGYCAIAGPIHDEEDSSPWSNLLWRDEQDARRILYGLRCAVDFSSLRQLGLSQIIWDDLDSLGFVNVRGKSIRGPQAWGKKLSGNFVEKAEELEKFNALVQFEPSESV